MTSTISTCATDIYGLSEVMGPRVAQEFAGDDIPTIWEDHFYPEIVNPETGEALPDGAESERVLTSLTKQALPVIRYRTGALSSLMRGSATPMRQMARIASRSDDMLIVRGVNVFPTQIEEQILASTALAPHFLIEFSRPARLTRSPCTSRAGRISSSVHACGKVSCLLRIKDMIGLSIQVEVRPSGVLERSTGKAVRIRDLRTAATSWVREFAMAKRVELRASAIGGPPRSMKARGRALLGPSRETPYRARPGS